jgi:site-specific recombinase XerD
VSKAHGVPSTHHILGDEVRALRRVLREQKKESKFVFTSQLGKPFTQAGFARMIERAGLKAGFRFKAHPHMLRHGCGYALAAKGYDARAVQLYLGHRGAQYAERYTT